MKKVQESKANYGWTPSLMVGIELTGGTWIPDVVKKDVGPAAAIAWGEVYRFTRFRDGVCRASIETMAEKCGMSPRSMADQLRKLELGGYIIDNTPSLFNKPHEYVVTDKAGIVFKSTVKYEQEDEFDQTSEELYNG